MTFVHLSRRRNVFIVSFLFVLLYVLFQCWSYYNLVDTTLKEDETVEQNFDIQTMNLVPSVNIPSMGQSKGLPNNIFFGKQFPDSFWPLIEQNANMEFAFDKNKDDNPSSQVHPMFKHLYLPGEDGAFTCLISEDKIAYSRVNDDYCDCPDGSDEPSTPACNNNGRFYCKYQPTSGDLIWVLSSYVNDGVCDCPDGTDERNPLSRFHESSLTSCPDLTNEMKRKDEEGHRIRSDGLEIKYRWIQEVPNDVEIPHKLFGSKGEFYKISQSTCWSYSKSKYTYNICPFNDSTQKSASSHISIGRNPIWEIYKPDNLTNRKELHLSNNFVLLLKDGDSKGCPEGRPRATKINFICDVENKIIRLSEDELCKYGIVFTTPAAC